MPNLVRGARGKARWALDYARYRLNRAPVIVLGNQKSGTSAIAHLLADCCGLTKAVDTPVVWAPAARLRAGRTSLRAIARKAPAQFSAQLIKEPHLTFAFGEVYRLFPSATYIFVVRDPRDNIRSILDRLGISGDARSIPSPDQVPEGWRSVVCHDADGETPVRHVHNLAVRWRDAARAYWDACELAGDVELVRYEDFLTRKEACIRGLAERIGRIPVRPISDLVDVQFQPKGAHRGLAWGEFYSEENLRLIEDVCANEMGRLRYDRTLQ